MEKGLKASPGEFLVTVPGISGWFKTSGDTDTGRMSAGAALSSEARVFMLTVSTDAHVLFTYSLYLEGPGSFIASCWPSLVHRSFCWREANVCSHSFTNGWFRLLKTL